MLYFSRQCFPWVRLLSSFQKSVAFLSRNCCKERNIWDTGCKHVAWWMIYLQTLCGIMGRSCCFWPWMVTLEQIAINQHVSFAQRMQLIDDKQTFFWKEEKANWFPRTRCLQHHQWFFRKEPISNPFKRNASPGLTLKRNVLPLCWHRHKRNL